MACPNMSDFEARNRYYLFYHNTQLSDKTHLCNIRAREFVHQNELLKTSNLNCGYSYFKPLPVIVSTLN